MSPIFTKFLWFATKLSISVTYISRYMRNLIFLFGVMALCWAVFQAITVGLIELTGFKFDPDYLQAHATPKDLFILKILQGIATVGTFLVPVLIFTRIKKPGADYVQTKSAPNGISVVLVLAGFICLLPAMEAIISWNEKVTFPHALSEIEQLFRTLESRAKKLTGLLVSADSRGILVFNVLILAILPALAEEFLFRGAIQRLIIERSGKVHLGIWISAFLFSLFHFQFYGFVPRLLFGALFGYIYFWGRSIWYPVLCHALNNSLAVVVTYYWSDSALEESFITSYKWLYILVGLGMSFGLYYLYYWQQKTLQHAAGS